jgi:hypothetical protein
LDAERTSINGGYAGRLYCESANDLVNDPTTWPDGTVFVTAPYALPEKRALMERYGRARPGEGPPSSEIDYARAMKLAPAGDPHAFMKARQSSWVLQIADYTKFADGGVELEVRMPGSGVYVTPDKLVEFMRTRPRWGEPKHIIFFGLDKSPSDRPLDSWTSLTSTRQRVCVLAADEAPSARGRTLVMRFEQRLRRAKFVQFPWSYGDVAEDVEEYLLKGSADPNPIRMLVLEASLIAEVITDVSTYSGHATRVSFEFVPEDQRGKPASSLVKCRQIRLGDALKIEYAGPCFLALGEGKPTRTEFLRRVGHPQARLAVAPERAKSFDAGWEVKGDATVAFGYAREILIILPPVARDAGPALRIRADDGE